eukprot:4090265-Alexandrium_andersonii.AAC.1
MSASLVGSEMCIRDRPEHRPCRLLTTGRAARTRTSRAGLPAMMEKTASVSYTHLTLPTICSV